MGLFDFLFKAKEDSDQSKKNEDNNPDEVLKEQNESEFPIVIEKTSYSVTKEEQSGIYEYINFYIAGTSYRQKEINEALKTEKKNAEENKKFDFEKSYQYEGMTNKEILEDTFDTSVFQFDDFFFSDCSLMLEPDNEYDSEAIAVYLYKNKVGYIPNKKFVAGKKHIYNSLKKNDKTVDFNVKLGGGKYKINRYDAELDTGESSYKLTGKLIIKSDK